MDASNTAFWVIPVVSDASIIANLWSNVDNYGTEHDFEPFKAVFHSIEHFKGVVGFPFSSRPLIGKQLKIFQAWSRAKS